MVCFNVFQYQLSLCWHPHISIIQLHIIYVIYNLILKIVLLIINFVEAYGRRTLLSKFPLLSWLMDSWQAVIYSKQPVLFNSDFQDVLFLKHNILPFISWEAPLAFASMLSGRKHLILLGANQPVQLRLWWWKSQSSQSYWNIYTLDMTLQSSQCKYPIDPDSLHICLWSERHWKNKKSKFSLGHSIWFMSTQHRNPCRNGCTCLRYPKVPRDGCGDSCVRTAKEMPMTTRKDSRYKLQPGRMILKKCMCSCLMEKV